MRRIPGKKPDGILARHEPELVLMDVRLPDANGMDLLPQLAAEQTVIVITAYGSVKECGESDAGRDRGLPDQANQSR